MVLCEMQKVILSSNIVSVWLEAPKNLNILQITLISSTAAIFQSL